jgi:pantoate--beta-alanine ligase
MKLIRILAEFRRWRAAAQTAKVVLVPTMGALHAGHAHLVEQARSLAGKSGKVVVWIFVNPLQFGPQEDFSRYPRTLEADCKKCQTAGADVVFSPSVEEVYPADRSILIKESALSAHLCGASRPGHFDGVCTVVAKMFNMVQPQVALFGKKDYQQLAIIRRMVRDLDFPIEIIGIETVREADGLAMSSRNRYLSTEERSQAPALRGALLAAQKCAASGKHSAKQLISAAKAHLTKHAPLGRLDYLEVVDAQNLLPVEQLSQNPAVMALAVWFGRARLIDNIELSIPTVG